VRITRLYHPGNIESGKTIYLEKIASHHLVRVLRTKKDSEITLFNGDGFEYSAILIEDNPKQASLLIQNKHTANRESQLRITLLQGISRGDRMDTCIQKTTELGISEIIPIICARTNISSDPARLSKKLDHWKQIAISACEQSGRCCIPDMSPVTQFNIAINNISPGLKLVLDPETGSGLKAITPNSNTIYLLAGPEGGLTTDEINLTIQTGFVPIQLGPRILRTETAGPACVAAIQTLWGDIG